MLQLIAMIAVGGIFFAGGLYGMGKENAGLALAAPFIVALAVVFARAQMGFFTGVKVVKRFTVRDLRTLLDSSDEEAIVYIANPDIAPVSGLFTCKLDGGPAIVLERDSQKETSIGI